MKQRGRIGEDWSSVYVIDSVINCHEALISLSLSVLQSFILDVNTSNRIAERNYMEHFWKLLA